MLVRHITQIIRKNLSRHLNKPLTPLADFIIKIGIVFRKQGISYLRRLRTVQWLQEMCKRILNFAVFC